MMRRLYFVLPNVESAKATLKEMLNLHIARGKIQFLGKRGELPVELPEASVFQTTDITRAAKTGILTGGFIGLVCGALAVLLSPGGLVFELITVPLGALCGALIGMWTACMVGSRVPNTKLEVFQPEINEGKVLMIVDVPQRRVEEISARVHKNPNAALRDLEPAMLGL
ncbi:MAG TPA: hypothetical protein VK658_00010 [Chryseolinea sp.]|nr:hypothetical protein [Chryseolinea sp.]